MGSKGKARKLRLLSKLVPKAKLENYFCTILREGEERGPKIAL